MLDTRPLRTATFRHLAAGYWVNEFGNWIGDLALAILVYRRTGSPLATATLFLALRFLPALLAPLLTTRVEALRPRLVLTSLYVLEGIFFGGMALLTRHFSLPGLLGLCTLDGILAITAKALTRSVSATLLLKSDMLREGNAILNLGAMASSALGPVIAGAAVAWKGAETALLVDAASFIVTALIIVTAPSLRLDSDQAAGFSGRLRAGIRVMSDYAAVRRLLIAISLVIMFASVAVPIEVVFAVKTLHAGDRGYGFLLGAWGVGMIVGGAGFAAAAEMRLIHLLGVGTLLAALGYTGLAVSPTLLVACVFSALGGVGNGAGWIAAVTAIQERIPLTTQSAVMSVLEGINQLMPGLGFAAGGAVTAATSPRVAYGVSAAGIAVVVILVALRPIDRVRFSSPSADGGKEITGGITEAPKSTEPVSDARKRVQRAGGNSSGDVEELVSTSRTLPVTNG